MSVTQAKTISQSKMLHAQKVLVTERYTVSAEPSEGRNIRIDSSVLTFRGRKPPLRNTTS